MAFAFDAFSASSVGTGQLSWTHTPVGTPSGVIVFVIQNDTYLDGTADDGVNNVTYGGVTMTEVTGSPNLHGGAGAERGGVHAFHLGTGIPTGAQTVVMNELLTGTYDRIAYCVTVTGGTYTATAVQATNVAINSNTYAGASETLSLSSNTCFVVEAFHSGQNAVTGIAPNTGWTSRNETDFTSQTCGCYTYDTVGSSDVTTVGWTQSSDDGTCVAVAIKEVASGTVSNADAGSYTLSGYPAGTTHRPLDQVAFDAISNATPGTGTLSWTHTPTGTPAGVLVYVIQNQASGQVDEVTGVTYGGVSMTEVSVSPQIQSDTLEEMAGVHAFFLGNPASGAQTVQVSVDATGSQKSAVCLSVISGSTTTKVKDAKYINDAGEVNPKLSTATGSAAALSLGSNYAFVSIGFMSGVNALSGITPLENWYDRYEYATGGKANAVYTYDILGVADVDSGWTQTSSEALAISVAIARDNFSSAMALGTYVLTGLDATTTKQWKSSVDLATYVLTGLDAITTKGYVSNVDLGSYTLTGFDAVTTKQSISEMAVGNYAMTGYDCITTYSAAEATVPDAWSRRRTMMAGNRR